MSRSYKKSPWVGDTKTFGKKMAARRTRRKMNNGEDLADGAAYKRQYSQYDVCDYGSYTTFDDYWKAEVNWWYWAKENLNSNEPYPDKEAAYKQWSKWYKRK